MCTLLRDQGTQFQISIPHTITDPFRAPLWHMSRITFPLESRYGPTWPFDKSSGRKEVASDVLPIVFLTGLHLISHSIKDSPQGCSIRNFSWHGFDYEAVFHWNFLLFCYLMQWSVYFRNSGARVKRRPHFTQGNQSDRKYLFTIYNQGGIWRGLNILTP